MAAAPAFPQEGVNLDRVYEAIRAKKIATAVRITEEISIDGHLEAVVVKLTNLFDF